MPSDYREEKAKSLPSPPPQPTPGTLMPGALSLPGFYFFPCEFIRDHHSPVVFPTPVPQQGPWDIVTGSVLTRETKYILVWTKVHMYWQFLPSKSEGWRWLERNLLLSIMLDNNGNQFLIPEREAAPGVSHTMFSGLAVTTSIRWLSNSRFRTQNWKWKLTSLCLV